MRTNRLPTLTITALTFAAVAIAAVGHRANAATTCTDAELAPITKQLFWPVKKSVCGEKYGYLLVGESSEPVGNVQYLLKRAGNEWQTVLQQAGLDIWFETLQKRGLDPKEIDGALGGGIVDFVPSQWVPTTCAAASGTAKKLARKTPGALSVTAYGQYKQLGQVFLVDRPAGAKVFVLARAGKTQTISTEKLQTFSPQKSPSLQFTKNDGVWSCTDPSIIAIGK